MEAATEPWAFHLLSQQVLNTYSVSKDLRTEEGCKRGTGHAISVPV